MKKISVILLVTFLFIGCSTNDKINVISREDGSGTRGAFSDIVGLTQNGVDLTIESSEITNSTYVMMSSVAGNKNAIGYMSLGSLNDSVKPLCINGVFPTTENIRNGTYEVVRSFNLVITNNISDEAKQFIEFILSEDGQKIVDDNGYVKISSATQYKKENKHGNITISGSSSVAPLIEKISEEYKKINPNISIDILQNDSTTGINSVNQGICDIGMSSRELKSSETILGLKTIEIAKDGIVVTVNKNNSITGLTSEELKNIYMGKIVWWSNFK